MDWLLLLGIHVVEIIVIGIVLLIRKNAALEKVVVKQNEYISAMSIIVSNSESKLKELDVRGAFEADDEVGVFFQNLRDIQSIVTEYNDSMK
jgi:hypothetical protein